MWSQKSPHLQGDFPLQGSRVRRGTPGESSTPERAARLFQVHKDEKDGGTASLYKGLEPGGALSRAMLCRVRSPTIISL